MTLSDILANLTPEEATAFQEITQERHFKKGTVLVEEGQTARSMFYLQKGALRSYFYKDGNDITDFFFFEHDFATDFASFYGNKPALLYLACMEDTIALEIKGSDLNELRESYPVYEKIGRITAEYAFLIVEERMRLLHTEDLETKFRWFMDKFPAIFLRAPQYHLASYLGVKPATLSRMKAKIGKQF